VFENRVLTRIFGPKTDEVTGGWIKVHNEEFHNIYFSPNIIRAVKSRKMRWAGHVERMGEMINAYKILVGRYEGKRNLVSPTSRWVDNIKMDVMEIGFQFVD
jgi:hypothetical protein